MKSSREKLFLKLLSAFLDHDFPNKENLTVEDYLVLFSIELDHLDTYNERETKEIGLRMKARIENNINFHRNRGY